MELALDELVPPLRPDVDPLAKMQIKLASESDEVSSAFARLNCEAYHIANPEQFALLEKKTFWSSKTAFVAYQGNDAVSCVYVFPISPTKCYVAWVATAEKHRKKGIAGALLRYALSKVGPEIKTAVLHASDMGMPVYAQLGFVAMSRFAFFEFDRRVDPVIVPPTITLDYACDAEAMLGVPDLALEKIGVNCSLCLKKISSKSSSVACADLCKEKDPFVVCEQCFEGKHLLIESRDFLRLSPHKTQRFAYHSFSLRLRNRMITYAASPMIGRFNSNSDRFEYLSYAQVYDMARKLATTLQIVLGSESSSEVVCVRCSNEDFLIADSATVFGDFVCGPIATSVAPSAMKGMIDLTKSAAILVSPQELASVARIVNDVALKLVLVMSAEEIKKPDNWPKRTWLMNLATALDIGKDVAPIRFSANPQEDLRHLIFTSGSTGAPKAVMRSDAHATSASDTHVLEYQVHFCFEPLALAASRINCYNVVLNGGRIDVFSGNFDRFWTEIRHSSPSWFSATPRIWNWCYSNFKTRVEMLINEKLSPEDARKKALKEFRLALGKRCKTAQTGSAKGSMEVYDWMKECFATEEGEMHPMTIFDGYGITEAGGISSNFKLDDNVIPHLVDVPEMGYLTSDDPPRGLLWVHTPELALGYFADSEKTRSDFAEIAGDGRLYFCTGDIVSLTKDREIHVIDRFKNFFKLSQGVFIAPESLEAVFAGSKFVEQTFVFAESTWDCIVCVVVPSEEVLRVALNDFKSSFAELCASKAAESVVLESMHSVGLQNGISAFEMPRAVLLDCERWSPQNGLMTPSFKTSRIGLRAKYGKKLAKKHAIATSGKGDDLLLSQSQDYLTASAILDIVGKGGAPEKKVSPVGFSSLLKQFCGKSLNDAVEKKVPELGIDSVGVVLLHNEIMAKLGVDVPFEILLGSTCSDVDKFISTAQKRKLQVSFDLSVPNQWADEIVLPDEIEFGSSSVNLLKCCVLTGASGFLGSFILKELLVQGCRVRALVRSEKKLRNDVERYKIDVDWSLVEVFEGDLALRNFGLSDERFSALGKEIDCVIHNGCDVNGLYPYSLLRGANVGGTIEAIRLAAKSRLIFVSSISSLCGPKEGFDDRPLSVKGIEKVHSGYGQTKRVSEILVEAAKAKGLRASIVRPGTIGPVSAWNENDTLTKLFFGIEQLKLAPNVDANISVAPVDWVARLVLASKPGTTINVLGQSKSWKSLLNQHDVRFVSLKEFVNAVKQSPSNVLAPLLAYFGEDKNTFPLADDRTFASPDKADEVAIEAKIGPCPIWVAPKLRQ